MKSFLTKLSSISVLYLIVSILISQFTPYHWGNPRFSTKIRHLENNPSLTYNTYFFGSSLIYRQIDPNLFDSIFNSTSEMKLMSYNLGSPSTVSPESYFLYENFLNSSLANNAKYCFLELSEINSFETRQMHDERSSYWQNYADIKFISKSLYFNNQESNTNKIKTFFNYSGAYLDNVLHLGHYGHRLYNENFYSDKYLEKNKNGFRSLDEEYSKSKKQTGKSIFNKRKQELIENPELLSKRKTQILKAYANISNSYDVISLQRLLKLIQKSKQKGIELIYILPPRMPNQHLINLSLKIPEENLIDMCNPKKHSAFYSIENSFDKGHLNSKGAILYTKALTNQFKKIYLNFED